MPSNTQRVAIPFLLAGLFIALAPTPAMAQEGDSSACDAVISRVDDGGSGYHGSITTLEDLQTGQTHEVSWGGSYGTFVGAAPAPENLDPIDDAPCWRLLQAWAFPTLQAAPDASLQWWLQAFAQARQGGSTWRIPVAWNDGEPELPGHYAIFVEASDGTYPMSHLFSEENPGPRAGAAGSWLIYNGNGHRSATSESDFRQLAQRDGSIILATEHGVVLQRGDRHAWVFISDQRWGGPDRLRHRSIDAAGFVDDDLLWISRRTPSHAPISSVMTFVNVATDGIDHFDLSAQTWRDSEGKTVPWSEISIAGDEQAVSVREADDGVIRVEIAVEGEQVFGALVERPR